MFWVEGHCSFQTGLWAQGGPAGGFCGVVKSLKYPPGHLPSRAPTGAQGCLYGRVQQASHVLEFEMWRLASERALAAVIDS